MKILIVMNDYMNSSNGMCISTQRFVRELRKLGHEVRILTNNRYGMPDYPLDVIRLPVFAGIIEKEGYTFAKVNRSVIREAVSWADIIHLEDPFLVCRRAAIEAERLQKPVTGTFHMYPENMTYAVHLGHAHLVNYRIMKFFLHSVYNRCQIIQCPTADVKRRLEHYGLRSQLEVISNGIDEAFLQQPRTRQFDGTLRVISVGRYAVEKQQKMLLHAIAASRHRDHIRLTLAGKGPLEKELKELAERLGVSVEFGFLPQEELRKKMLESDLYVHCANIEVEGMSCMEAFACGCVPLIADARLSSTKSFALHKTNLYPGKNPAALARALDYFMEHPSELQRQSEEYMRYASRQSVENCAGQLSGLLEQALGEVIPCRC